MKNNIKKFRLEKGYTLAKFSKLTNLSAGYLCHLENNTRQNPSYRTMCIIAKILENDITTIFTNKN